MFSSANNKTFGTYAFLFKCHPNPEFYSILERYISSENIRLKSSGNNLSEIKSGAHITLLNAQTSLSFLASAAKDSFIAEWKKLFASYDFSQPFKIVKLKRFGHHDEFLGFELTQERQVAVELEKALRQLCETRYHILIPKFFTFVSHITLGYLDLHQFLDERIEKFNKLLSELNSRDAEFKTEKCILSHRLGYDWSADAEVEDCVYANNANSVTSQATSSSSASESCPQQKKKNKAKKVTPNYHPGFDWNASVKGATSQSASSFGSKSDPQKKSDVATSVTMPVEYAEYVSDKAMAGSVFGRQALKRK